MSARETPCGWLISALRSSHQGEDSGMDDRCEKFLLVMAICIAVYGVLEFVIFLFGGS
jgi:hypothetical protein